MNTSSLLLTAPQAAARLGLRPQSLRLRRMRGQSPPYFRLSDSPLGRVMYPADELEAWIASRPRFTGIGEEKRAKAATEKAAGAA